MDSRTTSQASPKPNSLIIDTSNHHDPMVSSTLAHSPTSPFATFRSSPLNPTPSPSPTDKPAFSPKRAAFPASRPLRPFPSIAQSMTSTKPIVPGVGVHVRHDRGASASNLGGEDGVAPSGRRPQKTIEISSKWKGGFFVLGMTQAEFSRRD